MTRRTSPTGLTYLETPALESVRNRCKPSTLFSAAAVDHSPSVGAIAHYDANAFLAGPAGHVAYVAQVNVDDSIVIEEYNWGIRDVDPFAYHNPPRITHSSQVSNFIHIV
jgi:hypothetical protein